MKTTIERLQEKRQIELAKIILESKGYKVVKMNESSEDPYVGKYQVDKNEIYVSKDESVDQYYIHEGDYSKDEGYIPKEEIKALLDELGAVRIGDEED